VTTQLAPVVPLGCCADERPSARIADCARMKSHPHAIRDLV
jgi:hypothetical protein